MKKEQDNQYNPEETERRLHKVLRGAFSGTPTPLKDIPKKRTPSRGVTASRKLKKSV